MIFKVAGSTPGAEYEVDTEKLSCTCPQYMYRCSHYPATTDAHFCKHLKMVLDEHPEFAPQWMQKKLAKAEEEASTVMDRLQDPDGKTRYNRTFFDTYVYDIKSVLNKFSDITKYEFCGSYRRRRPRCSDLDVLMVITPGYDIGKLFDYLENVMGYELIQQIGRGDKKAAYMIDGIIHVDFKVIPEASWPFATIHFTGSKAHNIKMRQRAIKLGYSLSEYGLRDREGVVQTFDCKTEEDVFRVLRMPYVEPWNREE